MDKRFRKVVWIEGMQVIPEHFQQSDRYYEKSLHNHLEAIMPFEYGLMDALEIDVQYDRFVIEVCRAILPGGIIVDIPELDQPPEPRSDFPNTDKIDVYLVCNESASLTEDAVVNVDRNRTIKVEKKDLQVIFIDNESRANKPKGLKIAELVKSPFGDSFSVNREGYIPPLLYVSASPTLKEQLQSLIERLIQKRQQLSAAFSVDFTGKLYNFAGVTDHVVRMVQTLSASIPVLKHLHLSFERKIQTEERFRVHPEIVFRELSRLAGELSICAVDTTPEDFPYYQHDMPLTSFLGEGKEQGIIGHIDALLSLVQPERTWQDFRLTALKEDPYSRYDISLYPLDLQGKVINENYELYVGFNRENRDLAEKLRGPDRMREVTNLPEPEQLETYYRTAIEVTPVEEGDKDELLRLRNVPLDQNLRYFQINSNGIDWVEILEAKNLVIGLPKGEESIELIAVRKWH